jgi:hypothetical protein
MALEHLVIRDGDRVAATGRLVRDSRGDWFQPSLPIGLPGGLERTVTPAGRFAIRVVGADLDLVENRFEKAGAIEGWAAVEGLWSGEQLEVDRQSRATARSSVDHTPSDHRAVAAPRPPAITPPHHELSLEY